jgi:hypothetical protein
VGKRVNIEEGAILRKKKKKRKKRKEKRKKKRNKKRKNFLFLQQKDLNL